MSPEIESKLSEYFVNYGYSGFSDGKFKVGGSKLSSVEKAIKQMGFPWDLNSDPELKGIVSDFYIPDTRPLLLRKIDKLLKSIVFEKEHKGPTLKKGDPVSEAISDTMVSMEELCKNCIIIFDISKKSPRQDENLFAVDTIRKRIITEISVDSIILFRGEKKADYLDRSKSLVFGSVAFSPYTKNFEIPCTIDGVSFTAFNSYDPPPWRLLDNPPKGELTGFIKTLLYHLFPFEKDREFVLDWMKHCIFSRNQTTLVLAGQKGIGKNLLIEWLLAQLVGTRYLKKATQATLTQKFNPEFIDSKVVLFDEVVTQDIISKSALKRLSNPTITIESKGKDSKTVDNTASMAVLTNDTGKLGLLANDRRMSCPRMTNIPLKKIIPDEVTGNFRKALDDKEEWALEEFAKFGYFIIERKTTYKEEEPFRGDYFYELCDLALPVWFSTVLGTLAMSSNEEYRGGQKVTFDTLFGKDDSGNHKNNDNNEFVIPTKISTLKDTINNYTYRGGPTMGEITQTKLGKKGSKRGLRPAVILDQEFLDMVRESYTPMRDEYENSEKSAQEEITRKSQSNIEELEDEGDLL